MFMEEMLKRYQGFDGLNLLVNVGGGNGFVLRRIISKYPSIKGIINFDLPQIIENSPSYSGQDTMNFKESQQARTWTDEEDKEEQHYAMQLIASQLPSQSNPKAPSILDRILRLLANNSILTFSPVTDQQDGRVVLHYGLATVAKYFNRSPGIENVAGDVFKSVPEGDAFFTNDV
ncbi:hypothetical protein V6N13_036513 [Hibiscus sabdariffa]